MGLAVSAVAATFLSIRFAPSPAETAVLVVPIIIIALAVAGLMGARRGRAATFVAIALVLPYLIAGAAVYASAERVVNEVSTIFGETSSDTTAGPSPDSGDAPTSDSEGPQGLVDANGDDIDDQTYEGTNCSNSRPYEEYFDECIANGGLESDVGSGVVKGDAGFVDVNGDSVDDHYYDGVTCNDIEGGQQEFAECGANGGENVEGGGEELGNDFVDENQDGVDDLAYVDVHCAQDYPKKGAVYEECLANGGN